MQDTQLYQQILGLSHPWFVGRVDLKMAEQRVDIFVEHGADAQWSCPVCGKVVGLYDHTEARTWRHLDSCQLQTFLHARIPRTGCPEHGIHKIKPPWAETRSRFTLLMERMIIDVIRHCSTISGACAIMRVSWDEAFGVMQRAVMRGQERKEAAVVKHLGVDEKAFRKGHSYLTVVCDLERSTVQYVSEDRTADSLSGYYAALSQTQREGIEAVAMDMWEPYVQSTLAAACLWRRTRSSLIDSTS
jgi:transposase